MAVSTLYIMGLLFMCIIALLSFILTNTKQPQGNLLYGSTSTLVLLYSFGASLLMYGMMLYVYSALPRQAPLFLLLLDTSLLIVSLWTLFLNPLQVKNRVKGRSGLPKDDPQFSMIATTTVIIAIIMLYILFQYQDTDRRFSILLLMNLIVIPFVFLTTGAVSSFALNDFTYNF